MRMGSEKSITSICEYEKDLKCKKSYEERFLGRSRYARM